MSYWKTKNKQNTFSLKPNPHIRLCLTTICLSNTRAGKTYIFTVGDALSFNEKHGSSGLTLLPSPESDPKTVRSELKKMMTKITISEQRKSSDSVTAPLSKRPSELDVNTSADKVETVEQNVTNASDKISGISSLVRLMNPSLRGVIKETNDPSQHLKSIFRSPDEHKDSQSATTSSDSKWSIFKKYTFQEMKVLVGKTLHEAIQDDDLDRVQQLIEHNSQNAGQLDERGYSPLHSACENGKPDIAYFLCKNGAVLDGSTPTGYQPIQLAVIHGSLDCVKILFDAGVDKYVKTLQNSTLLHLAARHGHLEIVKWLVKFGLNPDDKDRSNRTPLSMASKNCHHQVEEYLKGITTEQSEECCGEEASPDQVIPNRLSHQLSEKVALIEKRKNFREQRKAMNRQSSSFLDFIRSECDN